jgi:hypothetical protein
MAGPNGIVCWEESLVGMTKDTVWYQYGFTEPQGPLPQRRSVPQGTIVRLFAEHLKENALRAQHHASAAAGKEQSQARSNGETAPTPLSEDRHGVVSGHIVLFSRTRNRLILNEADLVVRLEAKYGRPVIVVRMETLSFAEQVCHSERDLSVSPNDHCSPAPVHLTGCADNPAYHPETWVNVVPLEEFICTNSSKETTLWVESREGLIHVCAPH